MLVVKVVLSGRRYGRMLAVLCVRVVCDLALEAGDLGSEVLLLSILNIKRDNERTTVEYFIIYTRNDMQTWSDPTS